MVPATEVISVGIAAIGTVVICAGVCYAKIRKRSKSLDRLATKLPVATNFRSAATASVERTG